MPRSFHIEYPIRTQHHAQAVVAMSVYEGDTKRWLTQAINSIRQQTYTGFAFVIVIDGLIPDSLMTVIRDAAEQDERIMVVISDVNLGLSRCMNFVIDWCLSYKPAYFFRMDADDVSMPTRLQTQIEFLESHPHIHVLGSALNEINEDDVQVGARILPVKHHNIVRILPKRCAINHPTVVLRYQVLEDGYRYREDLRNTQDYFLWVELAAAGYMFTNLSEPLLNFRRVGDFYKRRGIGKSINEFKARFFAMRHLKRWRLRYLFHAVAVLSLRLMPPFVVKFAYKLDRFLLNR